MIEYKYLIVYVDKSGEQVSIPFYNLKWAKKSAKALGGLLIDIRRK